MMALRGGAVKVCAGGARGRSKAVAATIGLMAARRAEREGRRGRAPPAPGAPPRLHAFQERPVMRPVAVSMSIPM
jgi:hypothetical protein